MKNGFGLKGSTPIMPARFTGQNKEKGISDKEIAEKCLYRNEKNEICIPNSWIRGSLIEQMIRSAGRNWKQVKLEVSPRIQVEPMLMPVGNEKYSIFRRQVPVHQGSKSSCDFAVNPIVPLPWKADGIINTTLEDRDMKEILTKAGQDVGIGGWRTAGYGRFTVASFTEVTT